MTRLATRGLRPRSAWRKAFGLRPLAAVLLTLSIAACGDDDGDGGRLVVSAASSLKTPFTEYGRTYDGATVRLSFAGSDELAAQIRQGVKPDVFAAANTKLPEQLRKEGLVEAPVVFATNALVLAVPAGSDIDAITDLDSDDVDLAIGAEGVPVGDYTREVVRRLGAERSRRILGRVRSNEPDVSGIVGKLTQGAADAGFVYRTDVLASDGRLEAVGLPESLMADVQYGVAVVKGAPNAEQARAFVQGLLRGAGADALARAGFGGAP